ncbi:MAG: hypothetical protein JW841_03915 [Deltaproteobacteria bacterium]|nr:hypothetical protein [Deltaproteobacteria bacterium]
MKKISSILFLAASVFLFACGPKLSLEGSRVKLLDSADELSSCQPISNVDATAASKEKAEIIIRNKAGTMNADRVVIKETLEADGKVKLLGESYSCSATELGN